MLRAARESETRRRSRCRPERPRAAPVSPPFRARRRASSPRRRKRGIARNCRGRSPSGSRRDRSATDCRGSRRGSAWLAGRPAERMACEERTRCALRHAACARNSRAKRHQMIILHPDDVVVVEERVEALREQAIDAQIPGGVEARILLQVDPVMQDRPEIPSWRNLGNIPGCRRWSDRRRHVRPLLTRAVRFRLLPAPPPRRSSRTRRRCVSSARPSMRPPCLRPRERAALRDGTTRFDTTMRRAAMGAPEER